MKNYFKFKEIIEKGGCVYPIPKPLPDLEPYYKIGCVRKEDLENGEYYFGICRNSLMAIWDEKKNKFWYIRFKFDEVFAENINHFSDDNGYDLFVPLGKAVMEKVNEE